MDTTQTDQLDLDFDDITINLTDTIATTGFDSSLTSSMTYTLDSTSLFPNNHSNITISPSWNNTSPSWTFSDSDLISPNSGKLSLKGDDAVDLFRGCALRLDWLDISGRIFFNRRIRRHPSQDRVVAVPYRFLQDQFFQELRRAVHREESLPKLRHAQAVLLRKLHNELA